ncbi:MAG: arginine--tRNA ligase [Alphaproteobacteria bacterium]|nr:arginine--tRNA ligase [Alphaproteobacteria bacterium]
MSVFNRLASLLQEVLQRLERDGLLPDGVDLARAGVEPPRDPSHGDAATNAAMVLAKAAGVKPRELAAAIADSLGQDPMIARVEIAGPGFINLRLADSIWREETKAILKAGVSYGDSALGAGEKVNVEYVSVNPTGPLHIGHARGAVIGDALAALLSKAGYAVTREYYINDAGNQVDVLGRSAFLRYREALGETVEIPEGMYPGDYLKPVGERLKSVHGAALAALPEDDWLPIARAAAIDSMMALVKDDLAQLGVHQDVFTSERALVEAGKVDDVHSILEEAGHLYTGVLDPPKGSKPDDWEPRPQLLFRATDFGDDVDRPLKKSDGSWTYFASDIANHLDKYQRGFAKQINVWGADHGGYVKRMKAAVTAVSGGAAALDVKICQIVRLTESGELMKMSKRAGTFVTLRDLVDAVGKDVVRFHLLTRKNDAQMDFDLTAVKEQSRDNPVFYVHYAHARCCSVARAAAEAFPEADLSVAALAAQSMEALSSEAEFAMMRKLADWPRVVEGAALAEEPHRIAYYLYELAGVFHAWWHSGNEDETLRFIVPGEESLTLNRLALVAAVRTVIASGLDVFGVTPREELT